MKNKLLTASAIVLAALFLTSCSTSRGYSTHKKGYGCPNSSGIIIEKANQSRMA